MFSETIYQFGFNAVVFSSLTLLTTLILAGWLRRSAAAVFACCLSGLVVALLAPIIGLMGNSADARSYSIPVSPTLLSFGNSPIQAAFVVGEPATQVAESTSSIGPDATTATLQRADQTAAGMTLPGRFFSMLQTCSLGDVAVVVWLGGVLYCGLRVMVAVVGVWQLVRSSRGISGEQGPGSRDLVDELSGQRIAIRIIDQLSAPVAVQWPRRAILVSPRFFAESSDARIARILEHERAHILRRDQLTLLLEEIVASVFWFNPLVYITKRCADRAREDICDNWVLAKFDSADYCRDLVDMTEKASHDRPASAEGLAPGLIRSHNIASRVRSLLNHNRITKTAVSKRLASMLCLILFGLGSLAFFAGFDFAAQDEGRKTPVVPDVAQLIERIENFTNPDEIIATVTDASTGKSVVGAKVQLLNVDGVTGVQRVLENDVTDMAGIFRLTNLKRHESNVPLNYVVLLSCKGYASQIIAIRSSVSYLMQKDDWQISLRRPATLRGKVVDDSGSPVAGATVWQPMFLAGPVEGLLSAITNGDGRFEITDHTPFEPIHGKPDRNGISESQPSTLMMVRHPDYGRKYIEVTAIPGNITISIEKGFMLKGRVIDRATGKPMPGLTVTASGHDHRTFENATTQPDGSYQMVLMPISKYNVWVRHPNLEAAAQTVAGASGETFAGEDFQLDSMVTIKGMVIDEETGKPIKRTFETYQINWYGDARPKTTSECKTAVVSENGTFEMQVLPGTIFPYVGNHSLITVEPERYKQGVVVTRDEPIELKFRVRLRNQ